MLADAEPKMPPRGGVRTLDVEEERRGKYTTILRGVVHKHDHSVSRPEAMAGHDDVMGDPTKCERRRHDDSERLVDRSLHELRLGPEPLHLTRVHEERDDARQRRRDALRTDEKERAEHGSYLVRVQASRPQAPHHRVIRLRRSVDTTPRDLHELLERPPSPHHLARSELAARELQRAHQTLAQVVELAIGLFLVSVGRRESELVADHPAGQQVNERHQVHRLAGVEPPLELGETRPQHVPRDGLQKRGRKEVADPFT